jgi:hypothetical protein
MLVNMALHVEANNALFADETKPVLLRWKTAKIPIALSFSLTRQNPNIKADSETENAVRRSLETWEKAANIEFQITRTDLQTVSPSGNVGDGVNLITIAQTAENLSMFASETRDVSAQTRVFFNRNGFINEADIVLNPYQQFSTDGTIGTFDLEATVTHEIGHLLGLEHSLISSSTMYAQQGKNGIFNLPGFTARTLAEDDSAALRSLYGAKEDSEICCGKLQGKLIQTTGKPSKNTLVWLEDIQNGRLAAGINTNTDGTFKFDGLLSGIYRIYAQNADAKKHTLSSLELGEVEIKKGKTALFHKRINFLKKSFSLQYIGLNAQLAELSIPLNGGKSYMLYVGGKNLDAGDFKVVFNSPYFTVTPESIAVQDFDSEISVISFEVTVKSKIPVGQYSFALQKEDGSRQYFIGSLTIENFAESSSAFGSNTDD